MERPLIVVGAVAAAALAAIVMVARPDAAKKAWKTTDVWYHETDVALLARSERPQLVEFFHPD